MSEHLRRTLTAKEVLDSLHRPVEEEAARHLAELMAAAPNYDSAGKLPVQPSPRMSSGLQPQTTPDVDYQTAPES